MNYGEDIALWYLRLNGFFLIPNFVLHRDDNDRSRPAQFDLLAVRPPHVYETVGGQPDDLDHEHLFRPLAAPNHAIGLVCQVKTGALRDTTRLFRPQTMDGVVRKLGLLNDQDRPAVVEQLRNGRVGRLGHSVVAKVLISTTRIASPSFMTISLDHAEDFVSERAERYYNVKNRDRMLFPWGLFQYAINRAGRRRERGV